MEKISDIKELGIQEGIEPEASAKISTQEAKTWWKKGFELEGRGQFEDAKETYLRTLDIDPLYDLAYLHLGYLSLREGELGQALEYFQKALEINPDSESVYVGLGYHNLRAKKNREALANFKKALELNKDCFAAYLGVGEAYLEEGRPMEALQQYELAIGITPSEKARIAFERGKVFEKYQLNTDAVREFQAVIESDPFNSHARARLASFIESMGREKEALGHYRIILALSSDEETRKNATEKIAHLQEEMRLD